MKKYLDKEGRKIKLGGTVVIRTDKGVFITKATEELLDDGVRKGILHLADDFLQEGTHVGIGFYVNHLAERIGWNEENLVKYLDNLYKIYPTAVFHILLREIAIVLDQKYPDHIERSEEIWYISTATGKIGKMNQRQRDRVINFRNFAAFRTLDDVKTAMHILKKPIKELFSRPNKKSGK